MKLHPFLRMVVVGSVAFAFATTFTPSADGQVGGDNDDLFTSVEQGDITALNHFFESGGDPDERDNGGFTLFIAAAWHNQIEIMRVLLGAGADIELSTKGGTALHAAVWKDNMDAIRFLIEAGAKVDAQNHYGSTPLHVAGRSRHIKAVALLLEAGASVTIHNEEGELPLPFVVLDDARAGQRLRDCAQCPELVIIPAGEYWMGSPPSEIGWLRSENPVHYVKISRPVAVGRYEVTREEYGRFVAESGYSAVDGCSTARSGRWEFRSELNWRNPGYNQSETDPVVCVSWVDAKEYAAWLSKKTGKGYRLLSEAEWEYAARAGGITSRHWGETSEEACEYGNFWAGSPEGDRCDGHVHTSPRGSFSPNPFGLHDMLGNVWEWVEDCWNETYVGAPNEGSAWNVENCERRVSRGGSWSNSTLDIRSASRSGDLLELRDDNLGFRVARETP